MEYQLKSYLSVCDYLELQCFLQRIKALLILTVHGNSQVAVLSFEVLSFKQQRAIYLMTHKVANATKDTVHVMLCLKSQYFGNFNAPNIYIGVYIQGLLCSINIIYKQFWKFSLAKKQKINKKNPPRGSEPALPLKWPQIIVLICKNICFCN